MSKPFRRIDRVGDVARDVVCATTNTFFAGQPCTSTAANSRDEVSVMTSVLAMLRTDVTREDVLNAIREYDRLGADAFFAAHGYGASRTYELLWEGRRYPHKAILGTAYELSTGHRLAPGDFEGGKSGAVAVLGNLGFTVEPKS